MKKLTLILLLFLLQSQCGYEEPPPIPNPGFRIYTENEVRQGVIGFEDYINYPLPGAVTSGNFREQNTSQPPFTGTTGIIQGKVSNSDAYFDVVNGKAAAYWYFSADSAWARCNNTQTIAPVFPGGAQRLICRRTGGILLPITPSPLNVNDVPQTLQATIDPSHINTSYGMPIFQFEDYLGTVIGTTVATQINGYEVNFNSDVLSGQPIGSYQVKVYNAPNPNGIIESLPFGYSAIVIQPPPPPPPCYPQPGGIDQDTCEQVYGRTWNPETCTCSF